MPQVLGEHNMATTTMAIEKDTKVENEDRRDAEAAMEAPVLVPEGGQNETEEMHSLLHGGGVGGKSPSSDQALAEVADTAEVEDSGGLNRVLEEYARVGSRADEIERALADCADCCAGIHAVHSFWASAGREDANALMRRIVDRLARDLHRLSQFTSDREKRRAFSSLAFEILKYPICLHDNVLDAAFSAALIDCQREKVLKLKTGLLPGILVLACHSNDAVRSWAINSMAQMEPAMFTTTATVSAIRTVLDEFISLLIHVSGPSDQMQDEQPPITSNYNISKDPIVLWQCLACVIFCFTGDGIVTLLDHFPHFDNFVTESLSSSGTLPQFPHVLAVFSKIREVFPTSASMTLESCSQTWCLIVASPHFQMVVSTNLWLDDAAATTTTNVSDTWNALFSWIPSLLAAVTSLSSDSSDASEHLLLAALTASDSWTSNAQVEFARFALTPLLHRSNYITSLGKLTLDRLLAACLRAPPDDAEAALANAVAEQLDSDVDALETAFQDIYRDCMGNDTAASPAAPLVCAETWRRLVAAGGERPGLVRHVLRLFRRVFLLDRVNLEGAKAAAWSGEQRAYVDAFNRALSSVWFVVHRNLGNSAAVVSKVDLLYCLVCRSDEIAVLSRQILFKMSGTDSYLPMLEYITQGQERDLTESVMNILNIFRDLCTMPSGPPLLGCADRIQTLLKNLYTLAFTSDESYRFNDYKPDLWIKAWPFLSAILQSSAKWAKEDLSIKKDIKGILGTAFALVRTLLTNFNVLTSDALTGSAQNVYMATCYSIFQWYRVLDDGIRQEAVDVTVEHLRVAEKLNYVIDDKLMESILSYANGSIKSRLTEVQRGSLDTWVRTLYEKMDVMKAKLEKAAVERKAGGMQQKLDSFLRVGETAGVTVPRRKVEDGDLPAAKFMKAGGTTAAAPVKKAPAPKLEMHPDLLSKAEQPVSKLSQLRQEHIAEQTRLQKEAIRKRNIAAIIARADSSDSEMPDFSKMTSTGIKVLDSDMNVVDKPIKRPAMAPEPVKRKAPTRIRNVNELFKIFLRWRIDDTGEIPQDFPFELRQIPARFEGTDDYGNVFEPLLVLECWEQFKTSVEETDFSKHFTWTLEECLMLDEFHDITFTQPFVEDRKRIAESDIVYIQQAGSNSHTASADRKAFLGKVQKLFVRKGESTYIVRVFLKHNHTLVPLLFNNSKWSATKLFSMTTVLREFEALLQLPKVALCQEIITPLFRKKFQVKEGSVERAMTIFGANRPQAEAIATATQRPSGFVLIQGPPGTGKTKTILALVGSLLTSAATTITAPGSGSAIKPPGGGSAIRLPGGTAIRPPGGGAGIRVPGGAALSATGRGAAQPARGAPPGSSKKNRLLICAPSNAACDEIVRRLKMGILNAQGNKFNPKIVRLGTSDSIGVDIRDLTIEALVKEHLANDSEFRKINTDLTDNSQWVALEKHQAELNKEREALREKEQKSSGVKEQELIKAAIGRMTEKLKTVDEKFKALKQKRLEREGSSDHIRARVKASVLLEADVIMATLSGAGHDIVSTLQNFEFPTVIIDEACQSVELSSLIPLRYGAKKCIMVGDPMQLPPTVLSPTAKKYGYENSLFQRIMGMYGDSVCLLSIQYRMHPDISVFPSAQFYSSKLLDADDMEKKCTADWHGHSNYPAYRFLNIGWGRELRERHSLYNPDEVAACVNFVAKLCASFPGISFASRIGVITPYRMQMLKIRDKFKERFGSSILDYVDINTIDAFQGREKDIIILSTVRAGLGQAIGFLRDKRRMNVALTRAKNSLYILGREVSLSNNDDWRALVEDCQARNMFFQLDRKEFGPQANAITVSNLLG
ncbi:AAA domain-containing protein [Chytriomyces sp. MP71]|nr:AAA domain-containing protein [Chytriomyces sp. MP71]